MSDSTKPSIPDDSSEEETLDPKPVVDGPGVTPPPKAWWRLQTSDWIALVALLLALYAAGTEFLQNQIGPELELVAPANRVVEIRCVGNARTCLGAEDGSSEPRGRLSVILPFYFVNTGAIGQNEVVSRLWVEVKIAGDEVPEDLATQFPVTLYVNSDWKRTEGGHGPSTPFAPILIEGRNAGGAEYRAIDFDRDNRVLWTRIATAISEGSVTGLSINLYSKTELEGGVLTGTCKVTFTDAQRAALERRMNERGAQYLSTICGD